MCLNLMTLPDGQLACCHKCWQCLRDKVDDWVGRSIAESQTSVAAHAVTLTYGRDDRYDGVDHVRAAALTYSDIQKMFKLLRNDGIPVRYLVCGEYGATKARSHWHCLLFWQEAVPVVPLGENFAFKYWKHGHSWWDRLTPESCRYVAKYIAKETAEDGALFHLGMSRHPPLGDAYFRLLAARYVADRLAPQDWYYSFADVRKDGKQQKFRMQGKSRDNFLRYFHQGWWESYGDHPPNSPILEKWEDDQAESGTADSARRILQAEKVNLVKLRDHGIESGLTQSVHKPKLHQLRSWMDPNRLQFSELLNVWLYVFDGEQRPWYWAKDEEGEWGWRARIGVRSKNDTSASYATASRGA